MTTKILVPATAYFLADGVQTSAVLDLATDSYHIDAGFRHVDAVAKEVTGVVWDGFAVSLVGGIITFTYAGAPGAGITQLVFYLEF